MWLLALLIALGPGPAPARAQQAPPAGATIAGPEIAQRADEAATFLRDVQAKLAPSPELEEIAQKLPAASTSLTGRLEETRQLLDAQPDLSRLDALADAWRARRLDLLKWIDLVTVRATQLEKAIERLKALRETWRRARVDARNAQAPAPIIERVDSLLAAIDAMDGPVQVQRAAVLVLQDKVAREVTRCEDALALIGQARKGAATQLFARETPPIWSAESRARSWGDLGQRLQGSLSVTLWELHDFFSQRSRLVLQGVIFLLLAAAARAVRQRISGPGAVGEDTGAAAKAFEHPLAAAFLITVLSTYWIYPWHSRPVRDLVAIVGLIPVLLVIRPLVAPPLRPWLWALGILVVADRIRNIAALTPVLDQGPLLVETLIGTAGLASFLHWSRRRAIAGERMDRIQIGVRLMLLMFVLAFVADAIGNVSLAQLLAGGSLRSAYQVLALAAAVQVTSGLVAYALRSRTLQHLWMVQRHGDLLERRAHTLLRWVGIAAWFFATLESFSLLRPTVTATQTALTAELQRGALSISLGDILAFVFTIWLSFLISSFIRFVLQEDVFPRVRLAPGLPYAVSTVLHYLILFVGFLLGVAALGLDLNKFTVLGGALGVGIGFGLQSVVNNFVSGLIVLFERPVRVGDSVQIGDVWGDVRRIGIRATTLRTYEGAEVLIPNSIPGAAGRRACRRGLRDRAREGARAPARGGAGDTARGRLARAAGHLRGIRRQRAELRAARVDRSFGELAAAAERAERGRVCGAARGGHRDPLPAARGAPARHGPPGTRRQPAMSWNLRFRLREHLRTALLTATVRGSSPKRAGR